MGFLCMPIFLIIVIFVINEQTVISSLAQAKQQNCSDDYSMDGLMGVNNDSFEEWEEWMGGEGAGTLDYSSHINNYASD